MKIRLISLAFFLLCLYPVSGQTNFPLNSSGKIEFAEVVQADSFKKDDLFKRAAEWFQSAAKIEDYTVSIKEKDSVQGKITAQ